LKHWQDDYDSNDKKSDETGDEHGTQHYEGHRLHPHMERSIKERLDGHQVAVEDAHEVSRVLVRQGINRRDPTGIWDTHTYHH